MDPAILTDHEMSPVWVPSVDDVKSFTAKWLLKTSETRSLTWTATTGIVEDVTGLIDYVAQCLSAKTSSILVSNGIDTRVITEVKKASPVLSQNLLKVCTVFITRYNTTSCESTWLCQPGKAL